MLCHTVVRWCNGRKVDVLSFYHTCSVLVDAELAAAAGSTYNHDDDMP
jgi:hypothetical protein